MLITLLEWTALIIVLAASAGIARRLTARWGLGRTARLERVVVLAGMTMAVWISAVLALGYVAEITGAGAVSLASVATLLAAAYAAARWTCPALPAVDDVEARGRVARGIWWCAVPVVALHAFLLFDAVLRPPGGCDSLYYHLPLMMRWLHAGNLALDTTLFEFCFPGNCEAWQMLFLNVGGEALVNVSLVPLGLLLAACVYGVARELGAHRTGAAACTLMTLVCPMVALQMYSMYVDTFGSAFLMLGLYLALRLRRVQWTRHGGYLAAIGLTCGVAVGTKQTFIPWVLGVWLLSMVLHLVARPVDRRVAAVLRLSSVFTLCAVVGGGFWYFRSVYQTGWVMFPFEMKIAGHYIGSGWSWDENQSHNQLPFAGLRALAYPWFEWKGGGYSYADENGLGAPFATFCVAGVLFYLWRRRRDRASRCIKIVLVAALFAGALLYVYVYCSDPRYILPLWIGMTPLCAPLMDRLWRVQPRRTTALLGATLALTCAMIGLWPAKKLLGRVRDGDLSRAHAYEMPSVIDDLPSGTTVLNLGFEAMNYPLVGADRQNRVIERLSQRTSAHPVLQPPLTQTALRDYGVDIVYARRWAEPPFAEDVAYEVLYDDSTSSQRLATTAPTQIYRIVQPDPFTSQARP